LAKFMTPKEIVSAQQLFEDVILIGERNFAKKLGNSNRLERSRKLKWKVFNSARKEWLDAWKRFLRGKGLGSSLDIRAGVQQTPEPENAFTLALLRRTARPDEIQKKGGGDLHCRL
jgi:hypothetical protein